MTPNDEYGGSRREENEEIARKAKRKQDALSRGRRSEWYGLGMFGLVGWAVAIPALLGLFLGLWIDSISTSDRFWTLSFLLAGVFLGCLNAWYWIQRESGNE